MACLPTKPGTEAVARHAGSRPTPAHRCCTGGRLPDICSTTPSGDTARASCASVLWGTHQRAAAAGAVARYTAAPQPRRRGPGRSAARARAARLQGRQQPARDARGRCTVKTAGPAVGGPRSAPGREREVQQSAAAQRLGTQCGSARGTVCRHRLTQHAPIPARTVCDITACAKAWRPRSVHRLGRLCRARWRACSRRRVAGLGARRGPGRRQKQVQAACVRRQQPLCVCPSARRERGPEP